MLGAGETVTIVRHLREKTGDSYSCRVIVGVSWFGKRGDKPSEPNGAAPNHSYSVRIPGSKVPDVLPRPGDLAVRGILPFYESPKSLEGFEWFRIGQVGDNRRGRFLPHVVLKNED